MPLARARTRLSHLWQLNFSNFRDTEKAEWRFKASQLKRGMTFAKMDAIIRRNAEKAQQAKTNGRLQSTHYELPKQEATLEPQKHAESSISIPSQGLFDTNNPVCDPAEEEFRKECKRRKRSEGQDCKCLSFGTPCKLLGHSFQCSIVKDCNKTHRNSLYLHLIL